MRLRCTVDGLLVRARMHPRRQRLVVWDGDEAFILDALEAVFYEVVRATPGELLQLEQAHYRLLRVAPDLELVADRPRRRRLPCRGEGNCL